MNYLIDKSYSYLQIFYKINKYDLFIQFFSNDKLSLI